MRSKFFSFIALLAVAGAHAEDVDLEKVVGSLIAAEKAYAKLAAEKGFREGSISVFADDAVIFAPNAVNGKKFWRERRRIREGDDRGRSSATPNECPPIVRLGKRLAELTPPSGQSLSSR